MKLVKLKRGVSQTDLFYWLLIITPLVDTVNGAYVLNHGESGASIGTIYRLLLILLAFYVYVSHKVKREYMVWMLLAFYFPLNCVMRYDMYGISFMSALSYGIKWMFPIFLIVGFVILQKKSKDRICIKIMNCWCYLIPSLLIFEYILGIGERTYWDAGFRGLYYSINDVGFSLTMMMTYSLYRMIMIEMNIKYIIAVALNFIAIIILATKSCAIFTILGVIYFILLKYKKSIQKAFFYTLIVALLLVIGIILMQEKLLEMVNRYILFYKQTSLNDNLFVKVMSFLTSARTPRISIVIGELASDFSVFKVLFGWKPPCNLGAIEMDWFDSFFQHGVIGIFVLLGYCYSFMFRKRKYKKPWLYFLVLAMICSFFSGHVLNGALSSTVLAVVTQCAISSKFINDYKDLDQCEVEIGKPTLK